MFFFGSEYNRSSTTELMTILCTVSTWCRHKRKIVHQNLALSESPAGPSILQVSICQDRRGYTTFGWHTAFGWHTNMGSLSPDTAVAMDPKQESTNHCSIYVWEVFDPFFSCLCSCGSTYYWQSARGGQRYLGLNPCGNPGAGSTVNDDVETFGFGRGERASSEQTDSDNERSLHGLN